MKKVIIIASAVISIIYAIFVIIITVENWYLTILFMDTDSTILLSIQITIALLTILISWLVIFNIKLIKPLKLLLIIISILITLITIYLLDLGILSFISHSRIYALPIISLLAEVAIIITMLTYIHRALKPVEVKENK